MVDIGVAVVGSGFIGPVHVEALRRLGIYVTGTMAKTPELSEQSRAALGLPRIYETYDDVLADSAVQSIHLAVPNNLHYPMAKAALLAGKHVLCEKPLAMNSTESAELVQVAAQARRAAAVCYMARYYPLNLQARAMCEQGQLGDIYAINGSYAQDWLLYDTDFNWRVVAEEGGELRAIADIGTHWMDLVLSITGLEVSSIFADLNTVHKTRHMPTGEALTFTGSSNQPASTQPVPINTEDYGCILFRFNNGAKGSLWVSQVTAGRKNCLRYEIAGSKQALAWDSEQPNDLWIGHREKSNETLVRDPSLLDPAAARFANYPGGHAEGFPDTFKQLFRAFYDYIRASDFDAPAPFPTFAQGHREVLLCEAILRSHREQRWVNL